jgi:hypothetical protein
MSISRSSFGSAVLAVILAVTCAPAQDQPPVAEKPAAKAVAAAPAECRTLTLDQLGCMSREELEALYCQSPPAPVLDGYYPGLSIGHHSKAIGLAWKGKLFSACDCSLVNRWCCGLKAIKARVYCGESWFDGKPSLIMDYRDTSHVWHSVRDELREVAPGLYLGVMYKEGKCEPKFVRFFALECCAH